MMSSVHLTHDSSVPDTERILSFDILVSSPSLLPNWTKAPDSSDINRIVPPPRPMSNPPTSTGIKSFPETGP